MGGEEAARVPDRLHIGGASQPEAVGQGHADAKERPRQQTFVSLDWLRMFAAMSVVLYHFLFLAAVEPRGDGGGIRDMAPQSHEIAGVTPLVFGGWVGPEIFFVISGFVIVMSAQRRDALAFAKARFLRLWPAVLVFSTLAFLAVLASGVMPAGVATERYVRSLLLFPIGPWIDGVLWTLIAELVFYALVFGALLAGRGHRIFAWARVVLALQAVFWIAVVADLWLGTDALFGLATHYRARVLLLTTGCYFLLGIFGYELLSRGRSWLTVGSILVALASCLASLGVFTIASDAIQSRGLPLWVPTAIWFAALAAAACGMYRERMSPPSSAVAGRARTVGLMTYPLYLVHYVTGGFLLGKLYGIGLPPLLAVALATFACLLAAYLFAVHLEHMIRGTLDRMLQAAALHLRRKFA